MNIFDTLIVNPLTNLLLSLYMLFGHNLGWAIVVFTILLRFVLLPLTIKQIKQQKKMMELQPKIQSLQGKDPSSLTPEELGLMKEAMASFTGGCLPLLIQFPILIGLNFAIGNIAVFNTDPSKSNHILNEVIYFDWLKNDLTGSLNTHFFGFDLASIPSQISHDLNTFWPYVLLIAVLVITQFVQSKLMTANQNKNNEKLKKNTPNQKVLTKEEQEKKDMQESMQKITQMQTLYLIPVLVGVGAYNFTAALGVYWLVQNIFAIIQTVIQYRITDGKMSINSIKSDFLNLFNKEKNKNPKIQEIISNESNSNIVNNKNLSTQDNSKSIKNNKKSSKKKNKKKRK